MGSCNSIASSVANIWKTWDDEILMAASVVGSVVVGAPPQATFKTLQEYNKAVKNVIKKWNDFFPDSLTLGPRQLTLGPKNSGTLRAGGGRVYITPAPLSVDEVKIVIRKTKHKGKTDVTVCKHLPSGRCKEIWNFTFEKGDSNIGSTKSKTLDGLEGCLLSIHLNLKGVGKSMSYTLRATTTESWKSDRREGGRTARVVNQEDSTPVGRISESVEQSAILLASEVQGSRGGGGSNSDDAQENRNSRGQRSRRSQNGPRKNKDSSRRRRTGQTNSKVPRRRRTRGEDGEVQSVGNAYRPKARKNRRGNSIPFSPQSGVWASLGSEDSTDEPRISLRSGLTAVAEDASSVFRGFRGEQMLEFEGEEVPYFYQGDPLWNDITMTAETIETAGSAMTSVAMILAFYGFDVDPGTLDAYLDQNDGYSGDAIRWQAAYDFGQSNEIRIVHRGTTTGDESDLFDLVDDEFDRGLPCIGLVDRTGTGSADHFVVFVGTTSDGRHVINDPGLPSGAGSIDPSNLDAIFESGRRNYKLVGVARIEVDEASLV